MERRVNIDGQEIRMVANGATPRIYRGLFHKDVFSAMQDALEESDAVDDSGAVAVKDSEVFENLAFCMAMQGGSVSTGAKIEEWLEGFSPLAILNATGEIMSLWTAETETTSTAKKE